MAVYRVIRGIKYDDYSVLGLHFKKLNANYCHEVAFLDNCKDIPLLENGISLRANFTEISGESQIAKDFCAMFDYGHIAYDKNEFFHLSACPKYKNLINFSSSDYIKHQQYNNSTVMWWEFESGMLEVRPYLFDNIHSVIACSSFCYNYFKQIIPGHVKLIHVLHPFNLNMAPSCSVSEKRKQYGLSDDEFVVIFNFSYFSSYYRKNPELLLDVFQKSFAGKNNARLFIKVSGVRSRYHGYLKAKIAELGLQAQVILEERSLSRQDMIDILNMSDVYVSLHRGEGLGLGMLEAMSLGKTVVATNYGGNQDFVKSDFAFPIQYTLVKPDKFDIKEYRFVRQWAEPDKEQCIDVLRQLYADRNKCRELGKKAKDFVAATYSPENVLKVFNENYRTV